jgi:hypothetical protein
MSSSRFAAAVASSGMSLDPSHSASAIVWIRLRAYVESQQTRWCFFWNCCYELFCRPRPRYEISQQELSSFFVSCPCKLVTSSQRRGSYELKQMEQGPIHIAGRQTRKRNGRGGRRRLTHPSYLTRNAESGLPCGGRKIVARDGSRGCSVVQGSGALLGRNGADSKRRA